MGKRTKYFRSARVLTGFVLFTVLLALLISNRHSRTGTYNWLTPLWADQAGYYVYLPALFVYHFDAASLPENIAEKTGDGFSIDTVNNKVITRYTSGVAIMQAPFFILIHKLVGFLDQPQDGFSGIYHKVPDLAALFYCVLGVFFLWKFLGFYFNQRIVLFTVLAVFFGTNLYYYAVDSTGMSHIYSFALFAIAAWLSKKILDNNLQKWRLYFIAWSLVFALIVLVRPTNILLFPFLFLIDCQSLNEFKQRIRRFLTVQNVFILFVAFLIVFIPQFLYWKYVSGSFIHYSYEGYGFANWKSPKIPELWFSPNNGLFLYSPLYLASIVGSVFMIKHKNTNGWLLMLTFLVLTYVFASWFIFSFGCGFGSRNFVEYIVIFALPLGYLVERISIFSKKKKIVLYALICFMVVFNARLVYSYNRCFQGGDWDFQEYVSFIVKIRKYHKKLKMSDKQYLAEYTEYSNTLYIPANKINNLKFNKAIVRSKVALENENSEALLVLVVESSDSTIYWNSVKLSNQIPNNKMHKMRKVEGEFWLPDPLPPNSTIATYIWNLNKESLILGKLEISLE
jgi:hypothetical protein